MMEFPTVVTTVNAMEVEVGKGTVEAQGLGNKRVGENTEMEGLGMEAVVRVVVEQMSRVEAVAVAVAVALVPVPGDAMGARR